MIKKLAAAIITIMGIAMIPACSSKNDENSLETPATAASSLPIRITMDEDCGKIPNDCYSLEYDAESVPDNLLIRESWDDCSGYVMNSYCSQLTYDERGYIVMVSGGECDSGEVDSVCLDYEFDELGRMTKYKEDVGCDDKEVECMLYDYSIEAGKVGVNKDQDCDGKDSNSPPEYPDELVSYLDGGPKPNTVWDMLVGITRDILEKNIPASSYCSWSELDAQGYATQWVKDYYCDGMELERSDCAAFAYDGLGRMLYKADVDCETQMRTSCISYTYANPLPKAWESSHPNEFDDGGPVPHTKCGEHGTEHGDHCHCDQGYLYDGDTCVHPHHIVEFCNSAPHEGACICPKSDPCPCDGVVEFIQGYDFCIPDLD